MDKHAVEYAYLAHSHKLGKCALMIENELEEHIGYTCVG